MKSFSQEVVHKSQEWKCLIKPLRNVLVTSTTSLNYPPEIEIWDRLDIKAQKKDSISIF